jgi:hypothetical protein
MSSCENEATTGIVTEMIEDRKGDEMDVRHTTTSWFQNETLPQIRRKEVRCRGGS